MFQHKYILLFAIFLLFFGCFEVDVTHTQYADGSAQVTHQTDMSSLYSLLESYGSSYGLAYASNLTTALEKPCETTKFNYADVTCTFEENILTLSKRYKPGESFYKFEVKEELLTKSYRLTINQMPDLENGSALDLNSLYGSGYGNSYNSDYNSLYSKNYYFSDPENSALIPIMKLYGMEATYTITMPGEIKNTSGGKISGSQVTFDVLEVMKDRKPIVVESQEYNLFFIGGVIILVIIFFALVVLMISKPPPVQKV